MAGVVALLKILLNPASNNLRQPYRHRIANHFVGWAEVFVVEDEVVREGLDAGHFAEAQTYKFVENKLSGVLIRLISNLNEGSILELALWIRKLICQPLLIVSSNVDLDPFFKLRSIILSGKLSLGILADGFL